MSNRLLLAIAAIVAMGTLSLTFFSKKGFSGTSITETKVDPAFSAYISAYTSGTISNESTIRVRLANDFSGPITYDKPVEETYFDFSPAIEGKTYWVDARTLEFRPAKRLPSGQVYEATFFLSKLLNDLPDGLQQMKFSFGTMKQNFDVQVDGMTTTDKKTLRMQRMKGTLTTVDAADKEVAEKLIGISQEGRKLFIRWEHEGDNVTHHFTVDSIRRGEKASEVLVKLDGSALGVDSKKELKYEVPSLRDFKVMNVVVNQSPEQYAKIQFSDPIAEKQNLDGLISLGSTTGLRFSVEDNDIKVYPAARLSGTRSLTINSGVKNILGYGLPHAFTQQVEFEEMKPEVRLLGKGVILPASPKGLLFPFEAVSLKAVDVKIIRIFENNIPQFLQVNNLEGERELRRVGKVVLKKKIDLTVKSASDYDRWNTYSLDLSTLIKAEPGAIYKVTIGFKKSYSAYHCDNASADANEMEEVATEDTDDEEGDVGYYNDYYYDDYGYYDGYEYGEDYDYSKREDPCNSAYYRNRSVSRNVLSSDMGLIAKKGNNGSMLFAVADILSTNPVNGTTLEVYDYTQQLLGTVTTDATGMAKMELGKKRPYLLIAKNGTQRGYLKLDDGSSLSLSAFDVSGDVVQKGLKGFIYGERGVWRPGDTLFLSFILEDKQKVLPATHPVSFELVNPRGQLVKKTVRSVSVNGFYDFTTPTDFNAPTGTWTARVKVGGAVFTKDIKVETIMPNRLKLKLDFGNVEMFTQTNSRQAKLEAKWLHGAIAKNLKAKVDVTLWQTPTIFKTFDKYVFDDPAARFSSESQTAFDGQLNEEGVAEFTPSVNAKDAPGMLKAFFSTRVFEQGGAFSVDRFTINYSPYTNYVGLLSPASKSYWGTLETGKDHSFMLASVDENGKPQSNRKLSVKVYKLEWRWWWSGREDYLSNYVNSTYNAPYQQSEVTSANGRASFKLKVDNDNWGRYLVRVTDEESGHSTGQVVYFDWPEWMGSAMKNSEAATILQFNADKQSYKVGETLKLSIPSPGQGRALITVETGSKVLRADWVESQKKGNLNFEIPVTGEMAPNVYVHVTLVQPHAQTINDAPIRLYGVIPITVDDPETHLRPLIACADVWKPEEMASVNVSEENGKEMTYTLAIVDEGLLDLTRFKTPDPWNSFYAREALGVKTWDMYDLVMGAYGAELERILSIGGDGEGNGKGGNKANRFKPMVKFMGPYHLKKGEKQTKKFMMPQYVGSVRVMVVAGMNAAYGNTEKAVPVRKPLMILGTLPRVVGPGEEVDLPVSVFAMEKKVKNATVTIKSNELFEVLDGSTKSVSFKEPGDEVVNFRLKVKSGIGVGKVDIVATGAGETAKYQIEIDVRNPNPPVTKIIDVVIDPGKSWNTNYLPVGIAGTNKGTVEISSIPPLNLGDRLNYLIQYPHGCVEQTTSSVFPQLSLNDLMNLDEKTKTRISENIKAGINRLRSFQTSSGGLGYWPGDDMPSEWGTNYAGHFLIEAEKKGYTIPAGMLENWKRFQKQQAQNWTPHFDRLYYYNDDLMQSYRLYTLALAGSPELGAMNRLREAKNLTVQSKWRLAAAYMLAGQQETAKQLIAGASTDVNTYRELSYTFGSSVRDMAMILEATTIMKDRTKSALLVKKISETMSRSGYWMSTQETAYCLLAIGKFMGENKGDKNMNYACTINGKNSAYTGPLPVSQVDMDLKGASGGNVVVNNKGNGVLYARIILYGTPETGDQTEAMNDLDMTVRYTDMEGGEIDVTKLDQGTDFIAEVTLTNPGLRGRYDELALSQIFPSGWEIHNTRMDDVANPDLRTASFTYQDIRDDRVYTYFYLGTGSTYNTKTYRIQLNAAYAGRFYLPSTYCEAMYDNSISALKPGKWVTVSRGGAVE